MSAPVVLDDESVVFVITVAPWDSNVPANIRASVYVEVPVETASASWAAASRTTVDNQHTQRYT
jgi:hypothetical protein